MKPEKPVEDCFLQEGTENIIHQGYLGFSGQRGTSIIENFSGNSPL